MRNALLMPARPHSRDTQPNRACVGTEIACEKGVGCSLHAKKRRVRVRVRVTRVGRVPVAFAFFCFSPVFSVSALPRSGLRSPTTHMQDRTKYRILYMYQQQQNKTRDLIVRHRHGFSTPPSGESAEDHAPNFTDSPVLHSSVSALHKSQHNHLHAQSGWSSFLDNSCVLYVVLLDSLSRRPGASDAPCVTLIISNASRKNLTPTMAPKKAHSPAETRAAIADAAARKAASEKKKQGAAAMRLALDAPKSLNTERIPAVLFAFCAALLLVIDVATGHQHTVLTCGAAAGLLLLSAVCYFVTAECCSFTQTQAELDSKVGKLLLLMLVCVMFLDGWLYEEATYNHWGHSANVLKEERRTQPTDRKLAPHPLLRH